MKKKSTLKQIAREMKEAFEQQEWMNKNQLMKETGMQFATVQRQIEILKEYGVVEERHDKGQSDSVHYKLK